MRTGLIRLGAILVMSALVVLGGLTPAHAGNGHTFHYTVDGVAEVFGSTCPFGDWVPLVDTVCEDWLVTLYRTTPDTPKQHNRSPWRLELIRAVALVHPDGSVDLISEVDGIAEQVESTFDEKHLRYASVRADVLMSDGSTRSVDLAWDGTNVPLRTDGNNGPYNQANGIGRHYVDRCITENNHAHQSYRANVHATGTIDGTAVEGMPFMAPFDPFLGRGHFNYVLVTHGGSC